jgi:transcription initiation factor IIE alpha subunit
MPWCEECAKYMAPTAMNEDGTCPSCGRSLAEQRPVTTPITAKNVNLRKLAAGEDADEADMKAPWHFKVLMVLLALYLGYRVVQLFM